jgi:replicative DNA helicase
MAAESMEQARQNGALQNGESDLGTQLSQLQTSLDQLARQRKRLARSGAGVSGETLVQLTDGRRVPIRHLVGQKPAIWTLSNAWSIGAGQCADAFSMGRHTLLKITLASGRIVRVTDQQLLFGLDQWIRAGDLKVKGRIAIARQIPEPAMPLVWQDDHLLLLGHLVGDGSYLKHQPLRYTSESEENLAAVTAAAEKAFGVTVNRHDGVGNWDQLVFSGNGDRWHPAAMNKWLRDLGIFDQNSYIKHLPPEVFQLSNAQIAYLLQHAWATDGCVYEPNADKKKDKPRIFFATCSRRLADDIEALLLRLGFVGRLHETEQESGNPVFSVDISGADHQKRFLEEVGAFGPRSEPAKKVLALLTKIKPNTNVDTIPKEVWVHVKARMKALGITQRQMAAMRGTAYGGTAHFKFDPSRETLADYAERLDDDKLRQWARSDLFWDRIVKIEPDGKEETFSLAVPGQLNYLVDGVICHDANK